MIAIAGIGLCTAQGSAAEILAGGPLAGAGPLLWPPGARTTCRVAFAARGIDPALTGAARWRALADAALAELGGASDVPMVVGSCNGGASEQDGSWIAAFAELEVEQPIASAACASGLHALWLGVTRIEAGCDEVIVLAVDALSRASHDNFEGLRTLTSAPTPWQSTAAGFVPGEAGVAVRLVRARDGDGLPRLVGPMLGNDRDGADTLAELVRAIDPASAAYVLGQGTGPVAVDQRELEAVQRTVPSTVPIATALANFGHVVGAAGLLSVALAALARGRGSLAALDIPYGAAVDGRPIGIARGNGLVVCRALGGACAVAMVGAVSTPPARPSAWATPGTVPPLRMPLLRLLAEHAIAKRPDTPPNVLIVRLDAPLVPSADAQIGGRLLPSVVLEITPGFVAQLVARTWGYCGPALCLVGGTDAAWAVTLASIRKVHGTPAVLHVRRHDIAW